MKMYAGWKNVELKKNVLQDEFFLGKIFKYLKSSVVLFSLFPAIFIKALCCCCCSVSQLSDSATPWTATRRTPRSLIIAQSLPKFMSIVLVMQVS